MGFLETEGIVGNRKTIQCICQHATENMLCLILLRLIDIDGPDRIATSTAKFHEEHLAANELVSLSSCDLTITASCIFRPEIGLFLNLSRNFDICRIVSGENTLQHHGKMVA